MSQTSFEMDKNTEAALEELKKFFGVRSNAAVIRRSLALAQVAKESADERRQLTILDAKDKKEKTVLLASGL